tara:strand:- start:5603 stop:5836 length:234 start_codon:yes stop_codon:yes gene_type:complete
MATNTIADLATIAATAASTATASATPDDKKCSLRTMEGNVKITVIALAALVGVLSIALLLSCCKMPCRKKRKVEIRV